jgi:hypothetical protein
MTGSEFIRIVLMLMASSVISLLIVHQLEKSYKWNLSFWWILIFIPAVWVCLLIIFGLIKIALLLLIPAGIGFGIYYFFIKKKKAPGEQTESKKSEETP